MKPYGIVLETSKFEEYLSFMTEVLELDLFSLSETSMRFKMQDYWFEIRKSSKTLAQMAAQICFTLDDEEFESLKSKMDFLHYRRDAGFYLSSLSENKLQIVDPDGQVWSFEKVYLATYLKSLDSFM
jgi:hypothetical protein